MNKDGFLRALLLKFDNSEHRDIGYDNLEELLITYGLGVERKATQEDCENSWVGPYGVKVGEPCFAYTSEMKTLIGN